MSDEVLYLVIAECPGCEMKNRHVERYPEPIPLMQEIPISANYCRYCGQRIGQFGGEWDVHEDAEIKRVPPTEA